MKSLLFIISLAIISCGQETPKSKEAAQLDSIFQSINFYSTKLYSEPCCLQYKGKPLFVIGHNTNSLDATFSYRRDPNGDYAKSEDIVIDYLSTDSYFSKTLSAGQLNGVIFFSSDQKGKIFNVNAHWVIDAELVDTSGMEIIKEINKYFPCLPGDIKVKGSYKSRHKDFTETFKLNLLTDNQSPHNYSQQWTLDYTVVLTNKNGM